MRRRELSPSFFTSEQVAKCSIPSRLLFAGLWCLADREGRLVDDPWRIRLAVFPVDKVDVPALLRELAEGGLILRYSAEGEAVIAIPTFTKWQHCHPHEMQSSLPAPTEADLTAPVVTCNDMSVHVSESRAGSSGTSGSSKPSGSSDTDSVRAVFDAWLEATGKKATLTSDRNRVIRARLHEGFSVDELCDAVRGWVNDDWVDRPKHSDLSQLLRNAAHVEKFRDLWRNGRPVVVVRSLPRRPNPIDADIGWTTPVEITA